MARDYTGLSLVKILAVTLAYLATLVVVCRQTDYVSGPDPRAMDDGRLPEHVFVTARIQGKNCIAEEVITGRMPLVEAAALFGELNRLLPVAAIAPGQEATWVPLTTPVRTDEEWLCHQVINWIYAMLGDDPARAAEVLARLEAEYRAEQKKHGTVLLPDPATLPSVWGWLGGTPAIEGK